MARTAGFYGDKATTNCRRNDLDAAFDNLKHSLSKQEDIAKILYEHALASEKKGQIGKAAGAHMQAFSEYAWVAERFLLCAEYFEKTGERAQAIESYSEAIRIYDEIKGFIERSSFRNQDYLDDIKRQKTEITNRKEGYSLLTLAMDMKDQNIDPQEVSKILASGIAAYSACKKLKPEERKSMDTAYRILQMYNMEREKQEILELDESRLQDRSIEEKWEEPEKRKVAITLDEMVKANKAIANVEFDPPEWYKGDLTILGNKTVN